MAFKLVVVHPFHGYERGQEVTDQAEVSKLLAEHDNRVVKVAVPDAVPAPAAKSSDK